jgi:starch synthase
MATSSSPIQKIALLPWGDLIEDFLDGIGVSLEDFSSRMTGGWLFGYVEALALHGIRSSIFCFSARAERTVHTVHQATGAEIVLLRAPAAYRRLRRYMNDPYGWDAEDMFGASMKLSRRGWRLAHDVAPYLATSVMVLCREVRRARCRAIVCQEYEAPRFDAAVAVGGLLRIPVFATFQGGSWHRSRLERHLRSRTLRR